MLEKDEKPNKITLILRKEWLELSQQRGLVISTLLPPAIFAVLPAVIFYVAGHTDLPTGSGKMDPADLAHINPALSGLTALELGQAVIGQQFSLFLLLLPTILPSVIASYSIVGEKTSRTLEPVLATPVKTWELLLGKSLAALVPSVGLTWLISLIFIISVATMALSGQVAAAVISPAWLIGMLLCAPLLSMISVAATIAVSSRANDPRTAQQISAALIIPIMAVFFGQLTGLLVLSPLVAIIATVVLAAITAGVVYAMTRIFQRETILTRWT